MKIPKSIEVVRTSIKELSSLSNDSAVAIVASLSKSYDNVILTIIDNTDDLCALVERKPGAVFLGMMYVTDSKDRAKRIWLSDVLEQAGIPHTGSTRSAHELALQKDKAKQTVQDYGLATAKYQVIPADQPYSLQAIDLDFPLFVKPICGGGGGGIDEFSIVRTYGQLRSKIMSLRTAYDRDILIESYLEGREFSVAIIKDQSTDTYMSMPLELIPPENVNGERILGSKVKSLNQEKAINVSNAKERKKIAQFALDVFCALGARDYGRIDIRFDRNNVPHFLEANLIPSLISGYGSFPKAYKLNHGVEYDEMISTILLLGLTRTPVGKLLKRDTAPLLKGDSLPVAYAYPVYSS